MTQSIPPITSFAPTAPALVIDEGRARRRRAAVMLQAGLYSVAAVVGWIALPHTLYKIAFGVLCAAVVTVLLMVPSGRFDDKLER